MYIHVFLFQMDSKAFSVVAFDNSISRVPTNWLSCDDGVFKSFWPSSNASQSILKGWPADKLRGKTYPVTVLKSSRELKVLYLLCHVGCLYELMDY